MPRYVERFRCIGPQCEDTCCAGWPIHIDKKTYKAYRKESIPALKQLGAHMAPTNGSRGDQAFAVILPVGEKQQCPALQDGLCSVHATLGETYISNLCHLYPRVNRSVNGQLEQAISLSCPEAARLALLADDAFEFVEAPVQLREATLIDVKDRYGFAPDAVAEIRIFCMNVMRTRELPLWQRLSILGEFCETLQGLCAAGMQGDVALVIERFVQLISSGELSSRLDEVAPNHEAQAMVFATLWAAKGFSTASAFQQQVIQEISSKLGADAQGEVTASGLVAAYRNGMSRLDEALAPAPWMVENYLLNEMFTQLFPFNGANVYDSYLQLIARFGLLRLLLAAQCNVEHEVPPIATLVSTVHLHCRRFQHDANYTHLVNCSLHESGWAELNKLHSLLKT